MGKPRYALLPSLPSPGTIPIMDTITTREAASIIGVDDSQVRRYIRAGLLPAFRFGPRLWVIRRKDAEKFPKQSRGRPAKST